MTFSTALLKLTGMALNRGFEVPASAAAALLLLPGGRPPCDGQVKMLQVLDLEVVTIWKQKPEAFSPRYSIYAFCKHLPALLHLQ
jgi:hypothetical protein